MSFYCSFTTYIDKENSGVALSSLDLVIRNILPNSELQGVYFAESLLIGQCWYVLSETLEGVVDVLHPPPLPHVGGVSHLHLLVGRNVLPTFPLIVTLGEYKHQH